MKTLKIPVKIDGAIDILDIFESLSSDMLQNVAKLIKDNPLSEEKIGAELEDDILRIINVRNLEELTNKVKDMSPEFIEHVTKVLKELVRYEKSMM